MSHPLTEGTTVEKIQVEDYNFAELNDELSNVSTALSMSGDIPSGSFIYAIRNDWFPRNRGILSHQNRVPGPPPHSQRVFARRDHYFPHTSPSDFRGRQLSISATILSEVCSSLQQSRLHLRRSYCHIPESQALSFICLNIHLLVTLLISQHGR